MHRDGEIVINKDGTVDREMLEIVIQNGWALEPEWMLWLRVVKWFDVLHPKKHLPYKEQGWKEKS